MAGVEQRVRRGWPRPGCRQRQGLPRETGRLRAKRTLRTLIAQAGMPVAVAMAPEREADEADGRADGEHVTHQRAAECSPGRLHVHYNEQSLPRSSRRTGGLSPNGLWSDMTEEPTACRDRGRAAPRTRTRRPQPQRGGATGWAWPSPPCPSSSPAPATPSVETLWSLGVALGVPFSQLVDPPASQVRVVRARRAAIHAKGAEFAATLLSAGSPHARRDFYT